MRRKLAMAGCLVALVSALALVACGGDDDSGDETTGSAGKDLRGTTLTLWTMPNSPDPEGDLEKLIQPFTAKTGIKVKVEVVGWDVQLDRIRNAAVSGEAPDITQAGVTQVAFFAALDGFTDLADKVDEIGGSDSYSDAVWDTTTIAGEDGTWGAPWFTEARAVYYRKDVLEKAGLDPATAFKDWDTFRETLKTIKQKVPTIQPFGQAGSKAYDLVHNVMPFVWAAGGNELSDDSTKAAINSPEAQQGLKFMIDLIRDGTLDKSQLERDGTQVENQFKGGKLAVWIGGPWVLASVDRKDDDTWAPEARANVGVASLPAGPTGESYTFLGGSNLMVFKSSENQDAAWELLKYLTSDSAQQEYADVLGMFPAKESAQKLFGEQDPNLEAFVTAIDNGRTYAPIPQWAGVENAYKGSFGEILTEAAASDGVIDDATLKQQLDDAAKQADGVLAQDAG